MPTWSTADMKSSATSRWHLSEFEKKTAENAAFDDVVSNFSGAAFCLAHQLVDILLPTSNVAFHFLSVDDRVVYSSNCHLICIVQDTASGQRAVAASKFISANKSTRRSPIGGAGRIYLHQKCKKKHRSRNEDAKRTLKFIYYFGAYYGRPLPVHL